MPWCNGSKSTSSATDVWGDDSKDGIKLRILFLISFVLILIWLRNLSFQIETVWYHLIFVGFICTSIHASSLIAILYQRQRSSYLSPSLNFAIFCQIIRLWRCAAGNTAFLPEDAWFAVNRTKLNSNPIETESKYNVGRLIWSISDWQFVFTDLTPLPSWQGKNEPSP